MAIIRATIEKDGTLTNPQVIKAPPGWDRAVLEIAKKARYTPVTWHGQPVSVAYVVNMRVCPDETPPPAPEPTAPSETAQ